MLSKNDQNVNPITGRSAMGSYNVLPLTNATLERAEKSPVFVANH